jgi:hypothetical protein
MEQNGRPAGDNELILALAAGATVREAAERAGVGERTAHRRLADGGFRRAVGEARDRMFDAARGRLAGLASKAAETRQRLMESDKPSEARGPQKPSWKPIWKRKSTAASVGQRRKAMRAAAFRRSITTPPAALL